MACSSTGASLWQPLRLHLRRVVRPLECQRRYMHLTYQCFAAVDSFTYTSREEERIIRTTLHELGKRDDNMKLSLKVYYFQELSRTSLTDRTLSRDNRYESLKTELKERMEELSPAQVVAALVSSGRLKVQERHLWWQLARGIERHTVKTKAGTPGLSFSEVCLAMHCLAKSNVKIKERFYSLMLKFLLTHAELWTEFDMAWILSTMRRKRFSPFDEDKRRHILWAKVLRAVAAYFKQKVHFISPRGIVCILYEFSRLELFPGKVLFRGAARVRQNIGTLNDRGIIALAKLLANFDWPDKRMLKKLTAELLEPRRFVRIHPRMLVVVLHSYSKLMIRDLQLLEAACGVFVRSACKGLDINSTATLAYSLGRLGIRGPVWISLAEHIRTNIDRHPPLHLALIAHAFGKVAVHTETLLTKELPDAALPLLPGFSAKHIACLLDGLSLTGCFHESLFKAALEEYVRHGSLGGYARQQMMSRVLFSIVLESPSLLDDAPPAWRAMLNRAKPSLERARARAYHEELALCAKALSLRGNVRRRKGPYTVDLHLELPAMVQTTHKSLALNLIAEAALCPLTGELLGPARSGQRHLEQMKCAFVGLNRKEWLNLPTTEARVSALQALLSRYVEVQRRPIEELLLLTDEQQDAQPSSD